MKIIVLANDDQWEELTANEAQINWQRVTDTIALQNDVADVIFYLADSKNIADLAVIETPILINAVDSTLKELNAPANMYRINAWPGFLERAVWEVAGIENEKIKNVFGAFGKKITFVKDEPGFVAAPVIAMIINEAYFALAANVSSKEEIDIAMKLGTNYPYGPFEWAEKIGLKNIYTLLQKLSLTNKRYQPCALLAAEAEDQS